jgi:microcystin-dependent protein
MTSQDLVKGIDIEGLTTVTGSEQSQLVDAGRLASDKGMVIVTTDTAENTPAVPDPNVLLEGVIPAWWDRYIWMRRSFAGNQVVKLYVWTPTIADDPTLLKWTYLNQTAENALLAANNAQVTADGAADLADTANTAATNVGTRVTTLETRVDGDEVTIASLAAQIAALQSDSSNFWKTGDIKATQDTQIYDTATDEGWLICDGKAVSRTTFARLFAVIGTHNGAGDGSTTFNLPDGRFRVLVGDNNATLPNGVSGLTAKSIGDVGGSETVTLTARQSGLRSHTHGMGITGDAVGGGLPGAGNTSGSPELQTKDITGATIGDGLPAIDGHGNLQPYFTGRYLIKT